MAARPAVICAGLDAVEHFCLVCGAGIGGPERTLRPGQAGGLTDAGRVDFPAAARRDAQDAGARCRVGRHLVARAEGAGRATPHVGSAPIVEGQTAIPDAGPGRQIVDEGFTPAIGEPAQEFRAGDDIQRTVSPGQGIGTVQVTEDDLARRSIRQAIAILIGEAPDLTGQGRSCEPCLFITDRTECDGGQRQLIVFAFGQGEDALDAETLDIHPDRLEVFHLQWTEVAGRQRFTLGLGGVSGQPDTPCAAAEEPE